MGHNFAILANLSWRVFLSLENIKRRDRNKQAHKITASEITMGNMRCKTEKSIKWHLNSVASFDKSCMEILFLCISDACLCQHTVVVLRKSNRQTREQYANPVVKCDF